MVQVKIAYNAYLDSMSIHIDGRPVQQISRLTRLQTLPFGHWCAEIFRAIAEEVNDDFSLVYVGRPCESRVLSAVMAESRQCTAYSNRQPDLPDSALVRLKKLSALCGSGAPYRRFTAALDVYTDCPGEELRALAEGLAPRLAFCRISVRLHPLAEAAGHREPTPAFVVVSAQGQLPPLPSGGPSVCVLQMAGDSRLTDCRDDRFLVRVRPDELEGQLKEYLELLFWPCILRRGMAAMDVPESSPLFPSVTVLDKTQAQTLVTLPSSVEFGETVPVKVRTLPENAAPAKLVYRISDESVIRAEDGGLKAVGTGEAVVEVYAAGEAARLCSARVTAYRRNRIRQVTVKQRELRLCVGERATLDYTFEPSDADNESSILLVSSDSTVAAPERGAAFVARRPGRCRMILRAERVSAPATQVTVYPRLEGLALELEAERVTPGEVIPLRTVRTPPEATLDRLVYTVSPPELGVYDAGTGSFYAKNPGYGSISVANRAGTVRAELPVTVAGGRRTPLGSGVWRWAALVGLGLLAAYIISRFL